MPLGQKESEEMFRTLDEYLKEWRLENNGLRLNKYFYF